MAIDEKTIVKMFIKMFMSRLMGQTYKLFMCFCEENTSTNICFFYLNANSFVNFSMCVK